MLGQHLTARNGKGDGVREGGYHIYIYMCVCVCFLYMHRYTYLDTTTKSTPSLYINVYMDVCLIFVIFHKHFRFQRCFCPVAAGAASCKNFCHGFPNYPPTLHTIPPLRFPLHQAYFEPPIIETATLRTFKSKRPSNRCAKIAATPSEKNTCAPF